MTDINSLYRVYEKLKNEIKQLNPPKFPLIRKAECDIGPNLNTGSSTVPKNNVVPIGTQKYYFVCGLGGAICCGGTHLAIVPLDLVKCRMQVDATKYPSLPAALRSIVGQEGPRGLARGWAPTAIGYSMQGFAKFGFYEMFKVRYASLVGEEKAHKYRTLVYLAAGMSAEAIGDVALAPFEAVKVRMQTDPAAPRSMSKTLPLMYTSEGLRGLFKGLPPLWMRQIPYTASKFVCFELATEWLYKYVVPKRQSECSTIEKMAVTVVAGCVAGVVCAICSHPPDVLVSLMYKNANMDFRTAVRSVGVSGMWRGLQTRILMIASIAAAQLFIVDSVKMAFNLEKPILKKD